MLDWPGSSNLAGDDDAAREADRMALEVLESLRDTLVVGYRFLGRALFAMPFEPYEGLGYIGTDAARIRVSAPVLLHRYLENSDETLRDLLHLVVHCVFYHPFVGADVDARAWSLAADIVAEAACLELAGKRFESPLDRRREQVIGALEDEMGALSTEKLYRHLLAAQLEPAQLEAIAALFERDEHGLWYAGDEDESEQEGDGASCGNPDEQGGGGGAGAQAAAGDAGEGADDAGGFGCGGQDGAADAGRESGPDAAPDGEAHLERLDGKADGAGSLAQWERISKQMKVDLECAGGMRGQGAGGLAHELSRVNRPRRDYREFLRRFCRLDEELKVDDADFDPIFYTFGLQRYGNMPLVEPLEFKEESKIREFVIALDTSGSVEGELVKRFVEETYAILSSSASFFADVNVHIVQCDARIRSDTVISSRDELDACMRSFRLEGFGGTDFRPVFSYVDGLVEDGVFENLRGLVYFTDGFGVFPDAAPSYDTAFVFVDGGGYVPNVPAWAFKVVVDPSELGAVPAARDAGGVLRGIAERLSYAGKPSHGEEEKGRT